MERNCCASLHNSVVSYGGNFIDNSILLLGDLEVFLVRASKRWFTMTRLIKRFAMCLLSKDRQISNAKCVCLAAKYLKSSLAPIPLDRFKSANENYDQHSFDKKKHNQITENFMYRTKNSTFTIGKTFSNLLSCLYWFIKFYLLAAVHQLFSCTAPLAAY